MARSFRRVSKRKGKFKSRLELWFATLAFKAGLPFEYEADRIAFVKPSHYVPDWKIGKNVYIESKGYLAPSDRAKLCAFREQHPHIRILLFFGNAQNRLNKNSTTTYAKWAEKHGFEWWEVKKGLPKHWWSKYANKRD